MTEERKKQSCFILPNEVKRDLALISMARSVKAGKRISEASVVCEALAEKIAKEKRAGTIT